LHAKDYGSIYVTSRSTGEPVSGSSFQTLLLKSAILWLALVLMFPAIASAGYSDEVTLAWDANTETGIVGYKLHYGTASGVYTTTIDVGNVTQYTVGGLLGGQTYYFAATASDGTSDSGYSEEISYAVPLADSDGDGVADPDDAFPSNPAEWADTDADGVGNNADTDDDGDGVSDGVDRFPLDSSEWADLDNDGIGDNADGDDDADGVADGEDAFPTDSLEWADTDGDGIGNNADPDDDADGMPDEWEVANGLDPLVDDAPGDADADGISNYNEYANGSDPFVAQINLAPDPPLLLSPVGGAISTAEPLLEIDGFSDPDYGDTHAGTQWQIFQALDDQCVMDLTTTTSLTALGVPKLILDEDTEYYWRARNFDNYGLPSEWSQIGYFSTEYLGNDGDGNGVPDDQEVAATVDLDKDSVYDREQSDIKCVEVVGGKTQLGVSTRDSGGLARVISLASEDPGEIGAGIGGASQPQEVPFGLINFKVLVDQPGDEVMITIYFSKPAPKNTVWYKYDPVEGSWVDFSAFSRMSGNRKTLELTLTDGGEGDADGIANGIIVDPAGLVIPPSSGSVSDASDSLGDAIGLGSCFISASANRHGPVVSHGWHRAVRGREAAVGFAFVMLLVAGRCVVTRVKRLIRQRNQMAVGARLRS
jgi:hypothetical protein